MNKLALALIIMAILAGLALLSVRAYHIATEPKEEYTGSWRGKKPQNYNLERSLGR